MQLLNGTTLHLLHQTRHRHTMKPTHICEYQRCKTTKRDHLSNCPVGWFSRNALHWDSTCNILFFFTFKRKILLAVTTLYFKECLAVPRYVKTQNTKKINKGYFMNILHHLASVKSTWLGNVTDSLVSQNQLTLRVPHCLEVCSWILGQNLIRRKSNYNQNLFSYLARPSELRCRGQILKPNWPIYRATGYVGFTTWRRIVCWP